MNDTNEFTINQLFSITNGRLSTMNDFEYFKIREIMESDFETLKESLHTGFMLKKRELEL